ncbi:hypothetical protein LTR84_000285 [Exophiala bonariae]|uniref:Transcription factor domain-containing protein n=1 Tax=Exophiala bonariae TaxID=1690606 RepID=A0AAV9NQI5_9EURO|nr:hypothetical protein LTR84_000285 [Exophiala bonariae]
MHQAIFINYRNGVYQNNPEQQRRIVSHASKQKRTGKKTSLTNPHHIVIRNASLNQTNDVRPSDGKLNDQDDRTLHDNDAPLMGQLVASPTSDNSLSGLDPFGALPIRTTTAGVHEILQYLLHSYSATLLPFRRVQGSLQASTGSYLSAALANPEFFNAIVSMTSSAYEAQTSMTYAKEPSARVLYFRGQALKLLWKKLASGSAAIEVGTVMAIILLMAMDIAYFEAGPVLMHRLALRQIMKNPPGPESQLEHSWRLHNPKMQSTLRDYLSDKKPSWSLEAGETLLTPYPLDRLKPLTYMYPSAYAELKIYEKLPSGFQALASQGDLSVEVLRIVHRIAKVVEILEKTRMNRSSADEMEFAETYKPEHEFHECIDCIRRIPSLQPNYANPDTSADATIEHVICLALLTFVESIFGCVTYGPLFGSVQAHLRKTLQTCEISDHHEECITWAQMVAVWAQTRILGSTTGVSFGTILTGYTLSQGWSEIQDILETFLLTEEMAIACEQAWGKMNHD